MEQHTLDCLYTKQQLKKHKTFHDGILHLNESSPPRITLFSACNENRAKIKSILESRTITHGELKEQSISTIISRGAYS